MSSVVSAKVGNIVEIDCDAIIAAIVFNSWLDGVHGAIKSVAANRYHWVLSTDLNLLHDDLATMVVTGIRAQHEGSFDCVVFVRDNTALPLRKVVVAGLKAADAVGIARVNVPLMRLNLVEFGTIQDSIQDILRELAAGVREHEDNHPESRIKEINFVVYNEREDCEQIRDSLQAALDAR